MKRPQFLALIFGIVLFGMGMAVGILTHRLYGAHPVSASEDWRTRYVKEMHTRLKLNAEQVNQLNDILDGTRVRVRAVKDQYKPEMLKIKQQQAGQIQAMLDPQQRAEYGRLMAEQDQRAKEQDARDRAIDKQRAAEREARKHGQPAGQ